MNAAPTDNFVDLFSLMLHRAVAEKLRRNPNAVMSIARRNIENWLKDDNLSLLEWQKILDTETPDAIIKIISQDTGEDQRLRSSSPFAGVLSDSEREKIRSECAEIRPV